MSPDPTHETASTTEGPSLLEERSIGGILVHFLAIPTGVVGAGLVYLVSTNDFTRRNARNALDWHLTVLAFTVLTFGSLFTYAEVSGQGVTDVAVLPSAITTAAGLVVASATAPSTSVPPQDIPWNPPTCSWCATACRGSAPASTTSAIATPAICCAGPRRAVPGSPS